MAKRSNSAKRGKLKEELPEVVELQGEFESSEGIGYWETDEPEVEEASDTTVLVLTKDLKLNIKGPVSGTLYVFSGAGAKVPVKNEDVEGLLKKKNPNNCCSGTEQQPYFIIE